MNVMQLAVVLKQRLKMSPSQQFYLLLGGHTIPPQLISIGELYQQYKDGDGFLYFTYSSQECFG